jgi:ubiquinone biosynthesis protein UbiJ
MHTRASSAHKEPFQVNSVMFKLSGISVVIMFLLQQDKEGALHAHKEQIQVSVIQYVSSVQVIVVQQSGAIISVLPRHW